MRGTLCLGLGACLLTTGCGPSSLAKGALRQFSGARSKLRAVPGTVSGDFTRYSGVEIKPIRSDLGDLVSPKFKAALADALRKYLARADKAPFPGGSPTLTIEPEITWYDDPGGIKEFAGSYSHAVTLFWLSADGAPLGRVQVTTKEAAARTGDRDKAESTAKKLAKWFRKRNKDDDDD